MDKLEEFKMICMDEEVAALVALIVIGTWVTIILWILNKFKSK